MGFDSEAAATEVMRVRKSLAEKRVARTHLLDRDLDLDLDLDEVHTPSAPAWLDNSFANPPTTPVAIAQAAEPTPEPELDLDLDPWRQPGESFAGASAAQAADAIHFSLALEDYGMKPDDLPTPDPQPPHDPAMDQEPVAAAEPEVEKEEEPTLEREPVSQPEPQLEPELAQEPEPEPEPVLHAADSKDYDFTVTLALAHESAALELWSEARDLASEVLESDDPALVSEALSLLERLNQLELDAPPDTNWNTIR